MDTVDLRSDFLARPSAAMRAAAERAAGSLHFGLREDPHQQQLEARLAALLGKEDALVFPTCTMANTTALLLQAPPGSRVLTQPQAHVLVGEANAAAALGGLALAAVDAGAVEPAAMAMPDPARWQQALAGCADPQRPAVRLCVLENTHNRSGGWALPAAYGAEVARCARAAGARLHLDGARLFHAAGALGCPLQELAAPFDTVSLSLNKAFGAPIAAALAGPRSLIAEALGVRQRLGGGIRPVGAPCAATLAALDEHAELAPLPALAARLARGLAQCAGLRIAVREGLTNIVLAEPAWPGDTPHTVVQRLAAAGLLALAFDDRRIRFVLYRGIDADAVDRAIAIAQRALAR